MGGRFTIGAGVECDVETLINTRCAVQANSGAGKSYTIRRILEQTHGRVQHLVIDPEGEFSSLRERFDYVLAARQGADTLADPRTAKILAERLLELGVSAILDIYELKAHERIRFVRLFVEALVDAPKTLWHPALVVVDEAHVYCPQQGEAESSSAVIDLCTRGRKRGFCAVLATQRISKLHKDAIAECNNKLIGRSSLDIDMKRAADELGLTDRSAQQALRTLKPGEFYAYGPAFAPHTVTLVKVGRVTTAHPKAGSRLAAAVPAPSSKVKKILGKLADLPVEAEAREKTVEDLKKEIRALKAGTKMIPERIRPVERVVEKKVKVAVVKESHVKRLEAVVARCERVAEKAIESASAVRDELRRIAIREPVTTVHGRDRAWDGGEIAIPLHKAVPASLRSHQRPTTVKASTNGSLGKAERAILAVLANQPDGAEMQKVGLLAKYRLSGGFRNAFSKLRQAGYLVGDNSGVMQITEKAIRECGPFERLPSGDDLRRYWMTHRSFGKAERAILTTLIEAAPHRLTMDDVAERTGYALSGGFRNAFSKLRTAGVLIGANNERMTVSDDLREA